MDRFAQLTRRLLPALEEFRSLHISFVSLNESIGREDPCAVMDLV
jgi:hypothetical protein